MQSPYVDSRNDYVRSLEDVKPRALFYKRNQGKYYTDTVYAVSDIVMLFTTQSRLLPSRKANWSGFCWLQIRKRRVVVRVSYVVIDSEPRLHGLRRLNPMRAIRAEPIIDVNEQFLHFLAQ